MKLLFCIALTMFLLFSNAVAQIPVKMEDIGKHIGDSVKICTRIYGARYLPRVQGSPTYLDAGEVSPNNLLIILIVKEIRGDFEDRPEMMYVYKNVCITGKVDLEKGKPRIIIKNPAQIVFQE